MIDRYTAMGLQTSLWYIESRADCKRNLEHILECLESAYWVGSTEFPVKLMAIPEGAIQGFTDSTFDWEHSKSARELFAELPGWESDMLAAKAKELDTYIISQLRVRKPEFPDYYFNVAFIIDPQGEIIHQYHKLQVFVGEPSTVPHDVWDKWVDLYGETMDAFYPVCDTEIGRLSTIICMDAFFPETARGVAMNGAEVIYMPSTYDPYTGNDWYEIQRRSRAIDNSCYVMAPNTGSRYLHKHSVAPMDMFGGNSMIVDYKGQVLSRHASAGDAYVSAVIDIEALRDWRINSRFPNTLKDLRTEQYKLIYDQPVFPKNLALKEPPGRRAEREEHFKASIQGLVDRGVWKRPRFQREDRSTLRD